MNIEQNIERLKRINEDVVVQNLIAQANARYILLNTSESRDNFPNYTIKDESLNILALYYLEIGCSFAENQDLENAREPMEKGASILEYIHGSKSNKKEFSNYYSLISAMSYYVSFHYSKSFVLIKKTQSETTISRLIALFLRRDFEELNSEVQKMVPDSHYSDEAISANEDEIYGADKIYEITIAKSLYGFVKYLQSGDEKILTTSRDKLKLLKEIAELRSEPSVWWVIRLLLLISDSFIEASLWNSLGKHFDIGMAPIKRYIGSLVYSPQGTNELFITQRKALSKVLNLENNGCIVTIPTSSGKTRIAEIAILDSLIKHRDKKVLYIAPFRSLAFEIENSLERILRNVGISSSHLYGGNLFSRVDEKIIEESNVIIATPEKAKAVLRSNREITNQLKLIIIDEGHLLGDDKRLIVNEIFYEELRFFVEKNEGKFLLLSAVLPNSEDLAQWLTKSKETIYKDTWRPSDERLGVLEWTGRQVNLNWINNDSERPTFNRRFIQAEELPLIGRQTKIRFFPGDKNEAIAKTTHKLRDFGPVLIFVGIKPSVFPMAKAYLKCLGDESENFNWSNESDWKAYQLACVETYGETNDWLKYARKGILCHHGDLHVDVRLPLERLMRTDKPLVVISTSTLGQGVNLGISSVVFASIYQAGKEISNRDFWNIAGRAGRAFIDHEAKILISFDVSDNSSLLNRIKKYKEKSPIWFEEKKQQIFSEYRKKIDSYFDKDKINLASSGLLTLLSELKVVSEQGGIGFDLLLQLISENQISELEERVENIKEIDDKLDWIDDTFLALHDLNNLSDGEIDYSWIETYFRHSLAYIQINEDSSLTCQDLISFIKARVKGIVTKVGTDKKRWKSIIESGIPLNSDLFLEDKLPEIVEVVKVLDESDKTIDAKLEIAKAIIKIIEKIPVLEENASEIGSGDFDKVLAGWLRAEPFSELSEFERAEKIVSNLFSFKLPWIFNGISKKLRNIELEKEAELVEEIGLLIEIGLPNLRAAKIYQAGMRSRVFSVELAYLFENELWDKSITNYRAEIVSKRDHYKSLVSEKCGKWIDLLTDTTISNLIRINSVPSFQFGKVHEKTSSLIAKNINNRQYLLSPDLSFIKDITSSKIDFSPVNDVRGIVFNYDPDDNKWKMVVENPYILTD